MDGIIIVNKPKACTSHDVVYKIRKITGEKVGHAGTLDPLATGVLPILVGKGTLCSKYLMNHDKSYIVTLQLGKKMDTGDAEGNIIQEEKVNIPWKDKQALEKVFQSFVGKQEQVPPMYSAIKVKGKKLYEYARKGEQVEVPVRQIEIYQIKILQIEELKKQIVFQVFCSKGTYIRSLCEDIAEKLGTVGYMQELQRIQVGDFRIEQSVTIEQLEKDNIPYLSVEKLFEDKEAVSLEKRRLHLFLNGVKLEIRKPDGVYRIYCEQKFIGLGVVSQGLLKRDIVL